MPPIQITNEQRDAAIASGQDTTAALQFGIVDESLAVVTPPMPGYGALDNATKQAIQDGSKQLLAIYARYFQPVAASFVDDSPSYSFNGETQMASVGVVSFIPRKVLIQFNMSAYVDAPGTHLQFVVKINGAPVSSNVSYFFNTASDHRAFGASWTATLPAGSSTITATAQRAGGLGAIILDGGDMITLSVIG